MACQTRCTCKPMSSIDRSRMKAFSKGIKVCFETHIEGDFVGVMIIHPKNRRHRENVEENYRQFDNIAVDLSCLKKKSTSKN